MTRHASQIELLDWPRMISHDDNVAKEHDSFGEIEVPADALWGAQTERARRNFQLSGTPLPREFIAALALIKAAAARANAAARPARPRDVATAHRRRRRWPWRAASMPAQFPLDVFQTGSGTSTNMNANEVIATPREPRARQAGASQRPRQHVPEQQRRDSERDPRERGARRRARELLPALEALREVLLDKETRRGRRCSRPGRTHLMDAMPRDARTGSFGLARADRERRSSG